MQMELNEYDVTSGVPCPRRSRATEVVMAIALLWGASLDAQEVVDADGPRGKTEIRDRNDVLEPSVIEAWPEPGQTERVKDLLDGTFGTGRIRVLVNPRLEGEEPAMHTALSAIADQFAGTIFGRDNPIFEGRLERILGDERNPVIVLSFDATRLPDRGNGTELLVSLRVHRLSYSSPTKVKSVELLFADQTVGVSQSESTPEDTLRAAVVSAFDRRIAHSLWANLRVTGPEISWVRSSRQSVLDKPIDPGTRGGER